MENISHVVLFLKTRFDTQAKSYSEMAYRPFLHSTSVRTNNRTRARLRWTFSYIFCSFVHPNLDSVPLFVGMRERSIMKRWDLTILTKAKPELLLRSKEKSYTDFMKLLVYSPRNRFLFKVSITVFGSPSFRPSSLNVVYTFTKRVQMTNTVKRMKANFLTNLNLNVQRIL